jgi:hypothetical protein
MLRTPGTGVAQPESRTIDGDRAHAVEPHHQWEKEQGRRPAPVDQHEWRARTDFYDVQSLARRHLLEATTRGRAREYVGMGRSDLLGVCLPLVGIAGRPLRGCGFLWCTMTALLNAVSLSDGSARSSCWIGQASRTISELSGDGQGVHIQNWPPEVRGDKIVACAPMASTVRSRGEPRSSRKDGLQSLFGTFFTGAAPSMRSRQARRACRGRC